jgi:hypothetical protein
MDAKKLASLFDNPNFAKWFGKSKVVDKDGLPLKMAHWTDRDFDVFDTSDKIMDMSIPHNRGDNIGSFFSSSKNSGKYFGKKKIDAYLSMQKPKVFETQDDFRAFLRENFAEDPETLTSPARFSNDSRAKLEADGFDGVIIKKPMFSGKNSKEQWAIAFEPTQIKSVHNDGSFDPTNPNIYKSALPYAVAGGGLMSALSPSDAAAIESIRAKDAPLEEAWNPVEAFGGGLGGGLRAALAGIVPDGMMDWAINGLMSGGK